MHGNYNIKIIACYTQIKHTNAMHGPGAWSTSCIIKENIQINLGFDKHMTFNIYSIIPLIKSI